MGDNGGSSNRGGEGGFFGGGGGGGGQGGWGAEGLIVITYTQGNATRKIHLISNFIKFYQGRIKLFRKIKSGSGRG
jgi:hypothetical protein